MPTDSGIKKSILYTKSCQLNDKKKIAAQRRDHKNREIEINQKIVLGSKYNFKDGRDMNKRRVNI